MTVKTPPDQDNMDTTAEDDPIDIIEQEAVAIGQFYGVEQSAVMGQMLVRRILERLGGRRAYLAKLRRLHDERNAAIREKFTGRNLTELAAEFELTPRQVRNILGRTARA